MAQYLPAPLEVPVAFYEAEHDGRPWWHLCSQLEVVQVPGGHHGCLTIGTELMIICGKELTFTPARLGH